MLKKEIEQLSLEQVEKELKKFEKQQKQIEWLKDRQKKLNETSLKEKEKKFLEENFDPCRDYLTNTLKLKESNITKKNNEFSANYSGNLFGLPGILCFCLKNDCIIVDFGLDSSGDCIFYKSYDSLQSFFINLEIDLKKSLKYYFEQIEEDYGEIFKSYELLKKMKPNIV